ncbi:MAG TPA: iron-containing redox enzyme family protein [Polyangia bacterium]|nr:iron-containing redox enzyme family protein [Polyangia bacterium]
MSLGFPEATASLDLTLHRRLARLNELRLRPSLDAAFSLKQLSREMADRFSEETFLTAERAHLKAKLANVPSHPEGFLAWFETLRIDGPGQGDALFPWLAEHATLEQFRWFLGQEVAGEAGFEDLLALTQLKMPGQAKLEMARNFWDELGRGHAAGMHGALLGHLADALQAALPASEILPQPLALANLMSALAWNRRYAFQSLGALGVIELTAPGRAALVNAGLRRLGCDASVRKYFALHATLDLQHSASWNREVLVPLVAAEPRCARAFAEGALLRLQAGARCFDAYRAYLWERPAA